MPGCTSCTVLRFELSAVKTDMGVKEEELMILRASQTECGRMAEEIADLHALVEEQRRHMAVISNKELDPDVGIYTWLKQTSERHALAMTESKLQREQDMYALRATHVYEVAQLQQQVQALTYQNECWSAQNRQSMELLQSSTERLQLLESTLYEQRRQLQAAASHPGGSVDVDVGLVPLVKKGHLESHDDVKAYIAASVSQAVRERVAALEAEVDAEKAALTHVRDALNLTREQLESELETVKADAQQAKDAEAKACADSLEYVSQLRRVTDVSNEWKRKYEETRDELVGVTAALQEQKVMEEYAQKLADLVCEKQEWEVDKEKLNKLCSAYLSSIRHWQGEAKRVTDELVTALASRDAFQLRLYTVTAEKQALEDEKDRLTAMTESQKKACEFVADVGELWAAYCGIPRPVPVNPLHDVLDEAEQQDGVVQASKKGKKHRGKK